MPTPTSQDNTDEPKLIDKDVTYQMNQVAVWIGEMFTNPELHKVENVTRIVRLVSELNTARTEAAREIINKYEEAFKRAGTEGLAIYHMSQPTELESPQKGIAE